MYSTNWYVVGPHLNRRNRVLIHYTCPTCKHSWTEEWDSACDSTCPECDCDNITPLSWEDLPEEKTDAKE